ncbi:MAG: hypothetical protein ACWGQW_08515 [bacterium]
MSDEPTIEELADEVRIAQETLDVLRSTFDFDDEVDDEIPDIRQQ